VDRAFRVLAEFDKALVQTDDGSALAEPDQLATDVAAGTLAVGGAR
jgi:hypothetical protein